MNAGQMDQAIAAFDRFAELVPAGSEEAAMVQDVLAALRESQ